MPPNFAPQGYPSRPGVQLGAWPLPRIAALAVALAGLGTLIASLFSLYSATITPSSWDFAGSDAPSGSVKVGLGFYDTMPMSAPIIAAAIPMFMLVAGLTALPMVFRGQNQKPVLPAFFSLAAALVAVVLMIAGPMPGITVTGEMGRELQSEVGTADLNKLIDTVVPISPGVGLILALVFAVIGAAGALYIYILAERGQRAGAAQPQFGFPGALQPGMNQPGMNQPGMPQPGYGPPPQQFPNPSWQQPQHGGQHQGQNW